MSAHDIVATAQSLIRIPSVNPGYDPSSPGEANMTDWLTAWAGEHCIDGTTCEVHPGRNNVILRLRNGADHPHLLFNAHTDTVAVSGMSIAPFGGEVRDGRLWGRGAADMKGPLACMLHALLGLQANPSSWRGTLTLALVVDEEFGFTGILHYLAMTESLDFAIVGEPTRFEVERGCKGCLRFSVRALGKSAHSSTPEKGISAISAMAHGVSAMNRFFATNLAGIRHPALGCSTGSVGVIHGGSGVNIVPEFCEAKVDVRLVPGQDWRDTYSGIQRAVRAADASVRWDFDSLPMTDPPFCLEEDHPLVRQVCSAVGRSHSHTVNFSCDASKIAASRIPCLIFGPGDITEAHTADESIALDDLHLGVEAYTRIAQTLLPV